jgi:DNA-binding response OmpR family regulator
MGALRVLIASPDEELRARVAGVVASTEHQVALEMDTPFDALDACLEERADLAVLDEALRSMRGSEVASVLRDLHSKVITVVLHRGELTGDDGLLVLNPAREGFDEALANVLLDAGGRRAR